MREVEEKAARAFAERFGEAPEAVASAPGRVNLIGEYTDFNGGFVLPCAIDRRIAAAVGLAPGGEGVLFSSNFDEERLLGEDPDGTWADYPRGVAWAMSRKEAELPAFRAAFAGDVPLGSGLSSSAAIEAATALALDALFGLGNSMRDLVLLCQRAENDFVGVPSGIMDQYASLLSGAGSALLIDCHSLDNEPVPLDLEGANLTLLVCDTRVERGLADTGYQDRRETCEAAARALGVKELRDASERDLERLSGNELKRARHVVRENARVLDAVGALREGDFATFGRLMYDSHLSLRDDFEVSTPELDAFVETGREAGAPGSRLTGAGFGGCAIALVARTEAGALADSTRRRFEDEGFEEPEFYEFRPAAGAEVAG
ncbi:MAG: Galactokinase [uncultured Rubrobacteraceae bacterium]|uniref:Galactokinase n=1 Tax=uncultured Rubrobacteraceae bacterium TaxID=349277 RepID=A0A6J4QH95_9ACTN|nr:MAG: Galactokinase [uncultured Rubrobacteraceae bacterium]